MNELTDAQLNEMIEIVKNMRALAGDWFSFSQMAEIADAAVSENKPFSCMLSREYDGTGSYQILINVSRHEITFPVINDHLSKKEFTATAYDEAYNWIH